MTLSPEERAYFEEHQRRLEDALVRNGHTMPRPRLRALVSPRARARWLQEFDDWQSEQQRRAGFSVPVHPANLEWPLGRSRLRRLWGRRLLRELLRIYEPRGYRLTSLYVDPEDAFLTAVMRRYERPS